ncbi:growth/differentiation factor 10b isoform X2 [Mastacembelus armatus]|uniref:growth/differentiation factor 10b isoform X2 n=1 Tax=Mastacembelus armatus TaxID=205130 RepID=UPI000E464B12|nr:interferon gamma receptor 1-like isoform X2 [Mastacembelus armatus]
MYFSRATLRQIFLILVWSHVAVAYVKPPTNVTLQCHNLHNVLSWNYDKFSPDLRFKVQIGSTLGLDGYPDELWVESPNLKADVSFLSKPNNDYYVVVTAVLNGIESEGAPPDGISFSYFKDSPAMQKCFVDLPPVNVTALPDNNILLRFMHPWLYLHKQNRSNQKLKQKRHNASQDQPTFNYDVIINETMHHTLSCVTGVCEEKFPVEAAEEKHCLKITGELKKMPVRTKQLYCTMPSAEHMSKSNIYIYIGVSLLSVSVAVLVLIMVYQKKTNPTTPLPDFMVKGQTMQRMAEQEEILNNVEVEPTSPTPLLPELPFASTPSTDDDLRLPIGVHTEDEGVCDVDPQNDERPGYMPGHNLEEDETQNSNGGYEKRPVLAELGPDELAEGYRG